MKSMGHVAYDAFRKECDWLLPWDEISEETRHRWCQIAQEACNEAEART